MRKSFWIIPLLLMFAAIDAPFAHANTYIPTFTCIGLCTPLPVTAPAVSFPSPTTITVSWDAIAFTMTLPAADLPGDTYTWHFQTLGSPVNLTIIAEINDLTSSTPASFFGFTNNLNLPALPANDSGTLLFTPIATPEPPAGSLMLLGIGLVLLLRKRNSRGHQLAT